jgi:hypothetical protein
MLLMRWRLDPSTAYAAKTYPLVIKRKIPALQAEGHRTRVENWTGQCWGWTPR